MGERTLSGELKGAATYAVRIQNLRTHRLAK